MPNWNDRVLPGAVVPGQATAPVQPPAVVVVKEPVPWQWQRQVPPPTPGQPYTQAAVLEFLQGYGQAIGAEQHGDHHEMMQAAAMTISSLQAENAGLKAKLMQIANMAATP